MRFYCVAYCVTAMCHIAIPPIGLVRDAFVTIPTFHEFFKLFSIYLLSQYIAASNHNFHGLFFNA